MSKIFHFLLNGIKKIGSIFFATTNTRSDSVFSVLKNSSFWTLTNFSSLLLRRENIGVIYIFIFFFFALITFLNHYKFVWAWIQLGILGMLPLIFFRIICNRFLSTKQQKRLFFSGLGLYIGGMILLIIFDLKFSDPFVLTLVAFLALLQSLLIGEIVRYLNTKIISLLGLSNSSLWIRLPVYISTWMFAYGALAMAFSSGLMLFYLDYQVGGGVIKPERVLVFALHPYLLTGVGWLIGDLDVFRSSCESCQPEISKAVPSDAKNLSFENENQVVQTLVLKEMNFKIEYLAKE